MTDSSRGARASGPGFKVELVEPVAIKRFKKDPDAAVGWSVQKSVKVEPDSEEETAAPSSPLTLTTSGPGSNVKEKTNLVRGELSLWIRNSDMSDALLAVWKNDLSALKAAVKRNLHVGQGEHPALTLQLALKLQSCPEIIRELLKGEGKDMVNMKLQYSFGRKMRKSKKSRSRKKCYNFPLDEAIKMKDEEKSFELVQLLLEHGADPYKKGNVLNTVVKKGHLRVASLLQQHGVTKSKLQLYKAIRKGEVAAVQLLLECGASEAGPSPLLAAAENGHPKVLEVLIARGADVEATGPGGRKAIVVAAEAGKAEAMQCLLSHGAELQESIVNCNFTGGEVVRLLLDKFPLHPGHRDNLLRFVQCCNHESAKAYFEAGLRLSEEEAEQQIRRINAKHGFASGFEPRRAHRSVSSAGKGIVNLINKFVPCPPTRPKRRLRSNSATWSSP